MKSAISIIDYGVGNLFNLASAFRACGCEPEIVNSPQGIANASRILLPGVGAFEAGMQGLRERNLIEPLKAFASSGRPLLGICLGMQLLARESEEHGKWPGLDLIPGKVIRMEPGSGENVVKIPHMGWNALHPAQSKAWDGTILSSFPSGGMVYFVHSYQVKPEASDVILAEAEYGPNRICAVMRRDNIWGCQFHPERSGELGLKILAAFSGAIS